jgi:2-polyprenyl-3-methyl-5-hydroxy-6-metoxy-1,4-benzoquinol methylase
MKCRHCEAALDLTLVDLGTAPPSNAYLTRTMLKAPEQWYPLKVLICENCWLAQTEDFTRADELFDAEYAYFSSFSTDWLEHSQRYATRMASELSLCNDSHVVEIAANDGYLLQYFQRLGVPCTGVEPTRSTATAARSKGISIVEDFFGRRLAMELCTQGRQADLTAANNVLAHVPDINDFVAGFAILLKPHGVATFEFPHLLNLIVQNQFDTIYHEHFSYLSLIAVERIFSANGLNIFDVEEHPTHGGSLRVFAQRTDTGLRARESHVEEIIGKELTAGMTSREFYASFQRKAETVKHDLLTFLLAAKRGAHTVAGYGAAAKGNTLMNYAGVRSDLIAYVADRNPAKQGKFLPGSRIAIVDEDHLRRHKPRYIVILPWNLKTEVREQMAYVKAWGGQFVTAVPALEVSP